MAKIKMNVNNESKVGGSSLESLLDENARLRKEIAQMKKESHDIDCKIIGIKLKNMGISLKDKVIYPITRPSKKSSKVEEAKGVLNIIDREDGVVLVFYPIKKDGTVSQKYTIVTDENLLRKA